jgi:putative ABC transport system permease protein
MPFYLPLAFKNIFRDRRRSFTLGVNYFFVALLLLFVFSITSGVRKNITENIITSAAGHITVSGEYIVKGRTYQGIKNYPRIDSLVRRAFPDARVFTRYTLNSAVYYKGLSKRLSFVGIDPALDPGLRGQLAVDDGAWDSFVNDQSAVVMPRAVAGYFGLATDDDLLIATRSRFGAFNTGTVRVRGIYTTGNYFLRDYVISHFGFIQSLDLAEASTASKMYIFFRDLRGLGEKRDRLMAMLNKEGFVAVKPASDNDALNAVSAASPRYKVQDGSVNQVRLTLATIDEVTGIVGKVVGAVNGIGLFIAAIMLFIIALSIFINMRMTINDRFQEIGTLRAIGAERKDILALFVFENIFLSLVFIGAGVAAGLVVMWGFSAFVTLPGDGVLGLFLDKGRFVLEPTVSAVFFIFIALASLTALFSYFPARYGGRVPAAVALNATH